MKKKINSNIKLLGEFKNIQGKVRLVEIYRESARPHLVLELASRDSLGHEKWNQLTTIVPGDHGRTQGDIYFSLCWLKQALETIESNKK